jgi:inosose dehydratase
MSRRNFVGAVALPALFAPQAHAAVAQITIGITLDTRPDWYPMENFVLSMQEAGSVGYHWVETFWPYVTPWEKNPQALKDLLAKLNLKLETISNGRRFDIGTEGNFWDPGVRESNIEDHMQIVRFIHGFNCDHFKINCGARPAHTPENTPTIYKEMSRGLNELGKRVSDLGMKFGIHAHTGSIFETQQDVDSLLELTDPRYVHFIVDTGHVTMAGMDPVELTRTYSSRIIEYHLKDTAPQYRGGYKGPDGKRGVVPRSGGGRGAGRGASMTAADYAKNRMFFELGNGGVDFPGILAILNERGWKGWMTVELDSTGSNAKESCTVSKKYIETVLKLKV